MANRFLNNIKINDSYTLPPADGTADQIIKTDGLGELSFVDQGDIVAGEAEIAKTLQVAVKNVSGGELTKGTVVHVSPSASPPSGNIVEVIAADYDDATKMPAVGILKETIADDVEGEAVMAGALSGIATDSFTAGDELYVGADGALTNAKPQTAGQLIQKIAVCVKSHASNGLIKIFGAGRSNDVPLPLYIDHANQRLGIGTPSPSELLHIEGTLPEVLIKGTGVYDASVITMSNGSGDSSFITNYNNPGVKGLWLKYDNGSTGDATIKVGQNELRFDVNNGAAMYINSSRNVGIGTTSPAVKLHVGSTSTSGATTEEFRLQSGTSSGNGGTAIANLVTGNFGTSGIYFGNNTTYSSQPAYLQYRRSDNNTTLKFDVRFNIDQGSSGTRFNINSSGDVGIGATNPGAKLDVNGNIKMTETAATTDTDKFVVLDSGVLKYRTGAEVLSDIGGAESSDSLQLIDVSEPGNTTAEWSLIKTLPASTTSTRDTLFIKVVGGAWNDHGRYEAEITLSNRDSFNYFWEVKAGDEYNGGVNGSNRLKVIAYSQTDGTVDVYLYKASYMTGYIYATFQNTGGPEIITSLGSPTTTQPSGAEVFNTHGETYSANISSVNGKVGINAAYPGKMLELRGGANEAAIRLRDTGSNVWDIQNSTDGKLDFIRGGSNTYMRIDQFGHVGIGVTSHSFLLDIGDSKNDNDVFRVNGSNADVLFSGNTTAPTGGVGLWNFINTGTNATTRFYVQDANNSNDRLTFRFTGNGGSNEILSGTSSGRVGIGTDSPNAKLDIRDGELHFTSSSLNQNPSGKIRFNEYGAGTNVSGAYIEYNGASNYFSMFTNSESVNYEFLRALRGSHLLLQPSSGNVGIGTDSPGANLEVAGDTPVIRLTDTRNLNVGDWDDVSLGRIEFKTSDTTTPGVRVLSEIEAYSGPGAASGPESQLRFKTSTNSDTSATTKMTINAQGDVGIGTDSPGEKLSVAPGTDASGEFGQAHVGRVGYSGYAGFSHIDRNSTGNYALLQHSNGLTYLNASSGQSIRFRIDNSDKMILDSLGRVGIGTTVPDATLTVFRTDSTYTINLSNTEARAGLSVKSSSSFDSKLTISSGASSRQYIQAVNNAATTGRDIAINPYGGNVGIGTDSPSQKLHVSGNARVTGAYYDSNNSPGTTNQVLVSTVTGTDWVDGTAIPGLVDGIGTANYVARWTGTESIGIGVIYDNGTNVGINATSLYSKLHIGNSSNGNNNLLTMESSGAVWVHLKTGGNSQSQIGFGDNQYVNQNTRGRIVYQSSTTAANNYMSFRTNFAEVMRITNSNVGIGTPNPNQKLTIKGTDQYVAAEQTNYVWGGTTTIGVRMGTDATAGLLDFRRWVGSATTHGTALITQVNSDGGYGLDFRVDTKTSNTVATTSRMFLSQSGEVGIGTTSPGAKLDVNGAIKSNTRIFVGYDSGVTNSISCSNWFRTSGSVGIYFAGYGGGLHMNDSTYVTVYNNKAFEVNNTGTSSIRAAGDIVAYYSDERLKTNLGNITNAVDKVKKLNGFYYKNNELANSFGYTEDHLQVGVSAQEVEAIMPEVVKPAPFDLKNKENGESYSASGENYKTVKYEKLVPLLIEAIKEQQKQIDELKNQLDASTK